MQDYRIAGALVNKYFKRLFSDKDDSIEIVYNMKSKLNQPNELQKLVLTELKKILIHFLIKNFYMLIFNLVMWNEQNIKFMFRILQIKIQMKTVA